MGPLQALSFSTVDKYGIFFSRISPAAVSDANRAVVVESLPPTDPLPMFHSWRWDGSAWVPTIDYRGSSWYDPATPGSVFIPSAPDDAPPEGWVYWAPGTNAQYSEAALLARAKDRKRAEIDEERDRRINAPISFDGKMLDADKTAQSNIANKLLEIDSRLAIGLDMPPELLVWRDYHNQTHTFASIHVYREWLHGLTIAISQRGTEAYAWAWAKKDLLDSLTTIEEVEGMDLS